MKKRAIPKHVDNSDFPQDLTQQILKAIKAISDAQQPTLDLSKAIETSADPLRKHTVHASRIFEMWRPPSVDSISLLLKLSWGKDKIVCLAILLELFAGLRRCEVTKIVGQCLYLEQDWIELYYPFLPARTHARVVPIIHLLKTWLVTFPDFEPTERLVPLTIGQLSARMAKLMRASGIGPLGKNGLRKCFVAYMRSKDIFPPCAYMGQPRFSIAHKAIVFPGDRKWAEKLEAELLPANVLKLRPAGISKAEFLGT